VITQIIWAPQNDMSIGQQHHIRIMWPSPIFR